MMDNENIVDRLADDQELRQAIRDEEDPIKKAAKGLKEYIPVGVTSFYLTFFAAAADTPQQELIQFQVLPVLSLIATIILSYRKSSTSGSGGSLALGGLVIPPLALIGWIYVTGGQFFTLAIPPIIAAIVFAFVSLILPAFYAVQQN